MTHHIAVDIGASSGRLMLGSYLNTGKLILTQLHRFNNGFTHVDGHDHWGSEHLLTQILVGLEKAKQAGVTHCTLAIDTWAVDYVLLDTDGVKLREAIAYRDPRTQGKIDELAKQLPKTEHYAKTGIQFLDFNTVYQLACEPRELLAATDTILLMPDYLGYRLTGTAVTEHTNATTTALLNHQTGTWDDELLTLAGVRAEQFAPLVQPGHSLGTLLPKWSEQYDLPHCQLYTAATHDTASAVLAIPTTDMTSTAYISSGTWSLLGVENPQAITTDTALSANYSNEGGAYGTYRLLKNIMGLWLIQQVRYNWLQDTGQDIDFARLVELAEQEPANHILIDANDPVFLNPLHMVTAIRGYTVEHAQPMPMTLGQLARCVFDSLALSYKQALTELEQITGRTFTTLHVIGGGSQNALLNQLTANATGKTVIAGPVEATAIGNILSQLIATGAISDIAVGRALVKQSFLLETFFPQTQGAPHDTH